MLPFQFHLQQTPSPPTQVQAPISVVWIEKMTCKHWMNNPVYPIHRQTLQPQVIQRLGHGHPIFAGLCKTWCKCTPDLDTYSSKCTHSLNQRNSPDSHPKEKWEGCISASGENSDVLFPQQHFHVHSGPSSPVTAHDVFQLWVWLQTPEAGL